MPVPPLVRTQSQQRARALFSFPQSRGSVRENTTVLPTQLRGQRSSDTTSPVCVWLVRRKKQRRKTAWSFFLLALCLFFSCCSYGAGTPIAKKKDGASLLASPSPKMCLFVISFFLSLMPTPKAGGKSKKGGYPLGDIEGLPFFSRQSHSRRPKKDHALWRRVAKGRSLFKQRQREETREKSRPPLGARRPAFLLFFQHHIFFLLLSLVSSLAFLLLFLSFVNRSFSFLSPSSLVQHGLVFCKKRCQICAPHARM